MHGRIIQFRAALLSWYRTNARPLPWRGQVSPYHTWVSEIMLQQTQVDTVLPYFLHFIHAFPTIQALARAPIQQVLRAWEGLGYYRRAHNLHKAAQQVMTRHAGKLPSDPKTLQTLPGIGRYTAAAISSIAFGQPVAVVDGNIKRVLARLDDITASIDDRAVEKQLWARAQALLAPENPGHFNQAMMELGATLCRPAQPQCTTCPVQQFCKARARGVQAQRPVRTPKKRIPHVDVAAGVVWHPAKPRHFLIAQRPPGGMLAGLWEFPGGKQGAEETLPQTLTRELMEALGIQVAVGAKIAAIKHAFTHFRITLHAFHAQLLAGTPQAIQVADWRWITLEQTSDFPFAKTDRTILAHLQQAHRP